MDHSFLIFDEANEICDSKELFIKLFGDLLRFDFLPRHIAIADCFKGKFEFIDGLLYFMADDFMHFFIHCSVKFILDRLSGSSGGFFFSSLSVFSFEGVVQFNVVFEEEFEFYIIVFHERLDFWNGLFV